MTTPTVNVSDALKAALIAQNKYELWVEVCQQAETLTQALRELSVDNLVLDAGQSYEIRSALKPLLNTVSEAESTMKCHGQAWRNLLRLVQVLDTEIRFENHYDKLPVDTFVLNAHMIQSLRSSTEEEWMSDDQGGSDKYYSLTALSITLDRDVALAYNPKLLNEEDPSDIDWEAIEEEIENFFVDNEILSAEQLYYAGTISQPELALVMKQASFQQLPKLIGW